jgi:hypothetical protein
MESMESTPPTIVFLHEVKLASAKLSARVSSRSAEALSCAIGISTVLYEPRRYDRPTALIEGRSPVTDEQHAIVVPALKVGQRAHIPFTSGINNTEVGLLVEMKQRRSKVHVEIQPRFKLPSGLEDAFNSGGQARACRSLDIVARQVNAAKLEVLRLGRLSDCDMGQKCNLLMEQIRERETWGREDAAALAEVANYWRFVAKDASICVRLSSGQAVLPVKVAY